MAAILVCMDVHLCRRRQFIFGKDLAQNHIENRRQEKTEEGHTKHTGEDGHTHRMAHFRARTEGHYQWHNTHDKGKGGHQNGA